MTIKIRKALDVPTQEDFYFKLSLYERIEFSSIEDPNIERLVIYNGPIDGYCRHCKENSVFRTNNVSIIETPAGRYEKILPGYYQHILSCARNANHTVHIFLFVTNNLVVKVGQYPSLADLAAARFNKYHKILDEEQLGELRRGLGLYSHGIGIGSFVYLRRVFESLIRKAHTQANESGDWTKEKKTEYQNQQHMDKRILLLKEYLPEFLVKNRKIYAILGKGIHELTEDECRTYFPVLLDGIELILTQQLQSDEQKAREEKTQTAIEEIEKQLKE